MLQILEDRLETTEDAIELAMLDVVNCKSENIISSKFVEEIDSCDDEESLNEQVFNDFISSFEFVGYNPDENNVSYLQDFKDKPVLYDLDRKDNLYKLNEEEQKNIFQNAETLTDKEAREAVDDALYESILGVDDTDYEKKRKLSNWQLYNRAMVPFYVAISTVPTMNFNFQ